MNLNALDSVWTIGMILLAQAVDCRIDLDGIHVFRAPLQGATHVVAGTSADN